MVIQVWISNIVESLKDLWVETSSFLPSLIGALIVFIVGLIVATGLEKIVERLIHHAKLDHLLKQLNVESFLSRGGVRLNAGVFLGRLVYWFIAIAFLLAASDILRFDAFSSFLRSVLDYLPNVFMATLILIATLVAANFARGLVRASVMGARLHAAKTLSLIAWWGIFIFGFLSALQQLKVAEVIVVNLVTGLIAMLALAGGLAFGLGGRDMAARLLSKLEDRME